MTHATRSGSGWAVLPYGEDVTHEGVTASYATVMLWSDAEREAFGVFAVPEPDTTPEKMVEVMRELVGDDKPIWDIEYAQAPPSLASIPNELSARQFAQVLATSAFDVITEDEALAWASRGDLPKTLRDAIDLLPVESRFNARMLLASATTYYYDHPIVPVMGKIISGLLQRDIDLAQVWREGSKL